MQKEKLEFNRRLLYAGLSRVSPDRAVLKDAFNHWQSTMGNQEFDVLEVVNKLVGYLDLGTLEKKTLMITLHGASDKLLSDLPELPGFLGGTAQVEEAVDNSSSQYAKDAPSPASSPHKVVCEHFLTVFVRYLRKLEPTEYNDFRIDLSEHTFFDNADRNDKAIHDWAKKGFVNLSLPPDINIEQCKEIAHQTYMLASDFTGPMTADQIMVKAIDDCLNLDEAARFNPREFS